MKSTVIVFLCFLFNFAAAVHLISGAINEIVDKLDKQPKCVESDNVCLVSRTQMSRVDNSQSESIFRETIEVGDKQLLDEKVP
jgi:hypothetical protein